MVAATDSVVATRKLLLSRDEKTVDGILCITGAAALEFLRTAPDEAFDEIVVENIVQYLDGPARIAWYNDLYRVLAPAGKCQLVVPHWCANKYYGDVRVAWPPVSEMSFFFLKRAWRLQQAPFSDGPGGYTCDFEGTWSYNLRPDLGVRSQEYNETAVMNYKEACQDILVSLTKL